MFVIVPKKLLDFLISGRISVDLDHRCLINDSGITFSLDLIKSDHLGFVYEKYVGQVYESEGYSVAYTGLTCGMADKGIDLVAIKNNLEVYIQCKFWKKKIGKSHIEWVLYKASRLLLEKTTNNANKVHFVLVTNSKLINFSRHVSKANSNYKNVEFPILQYFLDHNNTQSKVKLEYREIPMLI
jgi:hypothetical protein